MMKELVYHAIRSLNQFQAANGISNTTIQLSIVMGANTPDYNNMKVDFGQYVQVFEDRTITNTTAGCDSIIGDPQPEWVLQVHEFEYRKDSKKETIHHHPHHTLSYLPSGSNCKEARAAFNSQWMSHF